MRRLSTTRNQTIRSRPPRESSRLPQSQVSNLLSDDLDKPKKVRPIDRMGVFRRLNINPQDFFNLDAKKQEELIKKYIANDLLPEQIAFYLKKLNAINTQVLNIQNEMDSFPELKSTDFLTGYYSYEKNNDREVT